jgi:hypothetical protein
VEPLVQLGGAILILVAFVGAQLGALRPEAVSYLVLNLVGSAVLAADAWWGRQWGFLLLEGVWALVSLGGLVATLRGARRQPSGH